MRKILKTLFIFIICIFILNTNIIATNDLNSVVTPDNASTEITVPDTLSSSSVLLMVISMFDIALGIGIINYVKKNKFQE